MSISSNCSHPMFGKKSSHLKCNIFVICYTISSEDKAFNPIYAYLISLFINNIKLFMDYGPKFTNSTYIFL